jgi:hypothetical protein
MARFLPTLPAVPDVTEAAAMPELLETRALLQSEQMTTELLRENLAQIELMLEDTGWMPLGSTNDLSAAGRARARGICRFMSLTNPLIFRGLSLRQAYVWGSGCTITASDDSDVGQDVNAVIQAFVERNRATVFGTKARGRLEWVLGTDGEVFRACKADRVTGDVDVTIIESDEIDDVLTDPDNKRAPWYYLRTYRAREMMPDGSVRQIERNVAYPALGYRLKRYPDSIRLGGRTYATQADVFVQAITVNEPSGSVRGLGDAFPALAWARAHKEFLEQWAVLMRALARFTWRHKTPPGKSRAVAADLATQTPGFAQTHVESPGYDLEAIPKTGATIDANSGKPLAAYVAAVFGFPVTILLGDPGMTGARAVAETMDPATELVMGLRRKMWAEADDELCQFVIDSSAIAPQGALRAQRISLDSATGRVTVELPEEDDRTIEVSFPKFSSVPIDMLAKAFADFSGNAPMSDPLWLVLIRQFLEAAGATDIDEIIDSITDADGNLIHSEVSAGIVAARAFNAGQDPAAALA